MKIIQQNRKPLAGIAIINTVIFLLMVAIAFIFDLPARNGWRFHLYMFVTYIVTTALWCVFMVVITRSLNKRQTNAPTHP
jgi:NADH:ubiquinone oxidoreductase subunit 3 (subunit A)